MIYQEMKEAMMDIEQMSQSLNTDEEIVAAILTVADDEENFFRIWDGDYSLAEFNAVYEAAFELSDKNELHWGNFETLERGNGGAS